MGRSRIELLVYKKQTSNQRKSQKTPDEMWFEQKPDNSHLRSLENHVLRISLEKDQQGKIVQRSTKANFLGYNLNTKGYRLADPVSN
jgi:hypothetical protein